MSLSAESFKNRIQRSLAFTAREATPKADGRMKIHWRQIYILPTKLGMLYGAMVIGMLIGANNYKSNPGFLFTYLLAALGVIALIHTWKNLLGLTIQSPKVMPVFLGSPTTISLSIHNDHGNPKPGISAAVKSKSKYKDVINTNSVKDIPSDNTVAFDITINSKKRGVLTIDRLVISTTFPFGLFRSWAYLGPKTSALIYPQPAILAGGFDHQIDNSEDKSQQKQQGDEFHGHSAYIAGESVKLIDWKVYARGKGLQSKRFATDAAQQLWLSWKATEGSDYEDRISLLTKAVIDCDQKQIKYGLQIPSLPLSDNGPAASSNAVDIAPDIGTQHRHQCLTALAMLPAY